MPPPCPLSAWPFAWTRRRRRPGHPRQTLSAALPAVLTGPFGTIAAVPKTRPPSPALGSACGTAAVAWRAGGVSEAAHAHAQCARTPVRTHAHSTQGGNEVGSQVKHCRAARCELRSNLQFGVLWRLRLPRPRRCHHRRGRPHCCGGGCERRPPVRHARRQVRIGVFRLAALPTQNTFLLHHRADLARVLPALGGFEKQRSSRVLHLFHFCVPFLRVGLWAAATAHAVFVAGCCGRPWPGFSALDTSKQHIAHVIACWWSCAPLKDEGGGC